MVYTKHSVIQAWGEEDPSVKRFDVLVRRKRLSPTTRYTYLKNVKRFVDWLEVETPQQAIEKLQKLTVDERTELIDDFIAFLLDEEMNTSTIIQLVRGGVKKWLLLNDVKMDWPKIQVEVLPGDERIVEDRMPSKEELKELLNVGNLRDRVLILVSTSSGLRIGTLASLNLGDITLDEEIPRIVVKRKPGRKVSRRMKAYATFITPEAKKMLRQYIQHREKQGEEITDRSPIITSVKENQLGKFLSPMYLSNHWRRLLRRSHLATKNGGPWHDIHLHTLRKYFETQCTNAGVKTTYREFWMGHTGRYLEESYFRGQIKTHIEEYCKAIPYLSVLAPEPQDYKALVEKVKFLEQNGKRKAAQIQMLRAQLAENRSLIETVDKLKRELKTVKKEIKSLKPEASA